MRGTYRESLRICQEELDEGYLYREADDRPEGAG